MLTRSFYKLLSSVGLRGPKVITSNQNNIYGLSSTLQQNFSSLQSSEAAGELPAVPSFEAPYTSIVNPENHSEEHIGLWYKVPEEEYNSLYHNHYVLPVQLMDLFSTFRETSFMIRKPSLSVINYIKQLNLSTIIPPKFLFYGNSGCGKTLSIAHVVHFLHRQDYLIFQVPFIDRWLKQPFKIKDEVLPSFTVPDRWDHSRDAAAWLKIFKAQNGGRLQNPEFVLAADYQFSSRESCSKGASLLSVVEMGINRPRLASDCALTVAVEAKRLACEGKTKVGVVIDGVNAAFTSKSVYLREQTIVHHLKQFLRAQDFTLCQAFLQFLQNDWHNGVVVGSVDAIVRPLDDRDIITPRFLLDEKGFESLDPFVAVPVPEYTQKEFESAYRYYASKKFIQKPLALTGEGKRFMRVSSGSNPLRLLQTVSCL